MPIIGQISILTFDPLEPTPGDGGPFKAEWARCDGRALNIADYPALFTVIGTTYGGDGTTIFKLPNLRGLTMIGVSPNDDLGDVGGLSQVALDAGAMPPHTHALNAVADPGDSALAADRLFAQPFDATTTPPTPIDVYAPAAELVTLAAGSVKPAGGGAAHDNMQPYLAVDVYIALTGVYPTRSQT